MTKDQIYREAIVLREMGLDAIAKMIERYERHIESLQMTRDAVDVIDRFTKYLYRKEKLLMDEMAERQVKATISFAAKDAASVGGE